MMEAFKAVGVGCLAIQFSCASEINKDTGKSAVPLTAQLMNFKARYSHHSRFEIWLEYWLYLKTEIASTIHPHAKTRVGAGECKF